MRAAQGAAAAAGGQGPALGVFARGHLEPAAVLAEAGADLGRVDAAAEPVVAEAHDAAAAARRVRPPGAREARGDAPPAAHAAEALGHLDVAALRLELLELPQALLPGLAAEPVHGLRPHPLLLLVHPGEADLVPRAHRHDPRLLALLAVPRVRDEAVHVRREVDLPVDLRLRKRARLSVLLACLLLCKNMCISIYIYIYIYIYTLVHIYIYIYIHTYVHTYIHIIYNTYIHRFTCVVCASLYFILPTESESPRTAASAEVATFMVSLSIYIYIYIYIEREREIDRYRYVYVYIYIYT